jgi:hypothetical protein
VSPAGPTCTIQHWVNGGRTDLDNLISSVPLAPQGGPRPRLHPSPPTPGGTFAFYRPDGTPAAAPALPEPAAASSRPRRGAITPDTIIPPWYGERLDLNHAI